MIVWMEAAETKRIAKKAEVPQLRVNGRTDPCQTTMAKILHTITQEAEGLPLTIKKTLACLHQLIGDKLVDRGRLIYRCRTKMVRTAAAAQMQTQLGEKEEPRRTGRERRSIKRRRTRRRRIRKRKTRRKRRREGARAQTQAIAQRIPMRTGSLMTEV